MNSSSLLRVMSDRLLRALAGLCLVAAAGCVSPSVLVQATSSRVVTLEEVAEDLAAFDVVFLGELHDSQQGHTFQYEMSELLVAKRGGATIAMEMFERDVQVDLDRYLTGELTRDEFLKDARPWGTFAKFYEPVVEAARLRGDPVVAANIPRPLASQVVREGVESIQGQPFAPRQVNEASSGAYRDKIIALMDEGEHAVELTEERVNRVVASQCVKDDAMAESIATATDATPGQLVIVLLGSFHSDESLGTVERLAARRPALKLAVVGMAGHGKRDADSDRVQAGDPSRGRYTLYVGDSAED